MCPPVFCPSCANFTLHKGTCETEGCGYDPRTHSEVLDGSVNYEVMLDHLEFLPGLELRLYERPFPRVALATRDSKILSVALINTVGLLDHPVWCRRIPGAFGPETWHGADFTHDMAKPFLAERGMRRPHEPCTLAQAA